MGRGQKFKGKGHTSAPFLKGGGYASTVNDDDLPPAFSFEKMQDKSGHSFNCCEDDDRLALARRMFMLSRMPWRDIKLAPSKGLGSEKISRKQITKAVPNSVTDDVDAFDAIHYVGKKRFVGYKVGRIFYVLWLDHDFTVYDHG